MKICEANIKPKKVRAIVLSAVFIVVGLGLYLLISYVSTIGGMFSYYSNKGLNVFDDPVYTLVNGDEDETGFHPIRCWYGIICIVGREFSPTSIIFWLSCIFVLLFLVVTFILIRSLVASKKCSLVLDDKGITGRKSGFFTGKEIKLPTDKIDSITIQNGLFDRIFCGKTIAVRSNSGLVKFPWIQNADEFVDATLAKIEEFKQSVKDENNNLVSAMINNSGNNSGSSSAAQQIKEIKDLLDNGLISQEEFEAKRKELLDKI